MKTRTLLSGIGPGHVTEAPFPHLVVHDVLDDDLCQQLIREYPPLDMFTDGRRRPSGTKIHYPAVRSLADSRISQTWKTFVAAHLTGAFFQDLTRVFRPHLLREYPDLERRFGRLDAWRPGLRGRDDSRHCDVLLDAQISIHTPVAGSPRADRGPHIKIANKPLEGFLYLRTDLDTSRGADHELYSILPGAAPICGWRQTVQRSALRLERSVEYRRNTLVVLLNSPRSVQGLSPRSTTRQPLMYFNFLAQLPAPLFELDRTPAGRAEIPLRRLKSRVGVLLKRRTL